MSLKRIERSERADEKGKDDGKDEKPPVVYVPQVVKRPKNLKGLLETEFEMDTSLGISARAAELFDFLARKAPFQLCTPALAFRIVMGMARMPREHSEEVMSFRGRSTAIREILGKTYSRGFVVEKPYGLMRATVDDEDLATTQQAREVERIRSAVGSAKRTNELINVNKVRDPGVRGWLKGGVSPLLKALEADPRIFQLLPHKPKKEKMKTPEPRHLEFLHLISSGVPYTMAAQRLQHQESALATVFECTLYGWVNQGVVTAKGRALLAGPVPTNKFQIVNLGPGYKPIQEKDQKKEGSDG